MLKEPDLRLIHFEPETMIDETLRVLREGNEFILHVVWILVIETKEQTVLDCFVRCLKQFLPCPLQCNFLLLPSRLGVYFSIPWNIKLTSDFL